MQSVSHGFPSGSHPLILRTASIVSFCHSNFTSASFSPARCIAGFGFNRPARRDTAGVAETAKLIDAFWTAKLLEIPEGGTYRFWWKQWQAAIGKPGTSNPSTPCGTAGNRLGGKGGRVWHGTRDCREGGMRCPPFIARGAGCDRDFAWVRLAFWRFVRIFPALSDPQKTTKR